jgi:hypothetical protein
MILRLKEKFVNKLVGYYDGTYYEFVQSKGNDWAFAPSKNKTNWPVLIVARGYYKESNKQYPITNTRELYKVLALEKSSDDTAQFMVGDTEGNHVVANKFELVQKFENSMMKIPETVLIATAAEHCVAYKSKANDKQIFVTMNQGVVHSATQTAIINSHEVFAATTGTKLSAHQEVITSKELANILVKGLLKLPAAKWRHFVSINTQRVSERLFKYTLLPLVLGGCVYLASLSAYLFWQDTQYDKEIASKKEQVSSLLSTQVQLDDDLADIELYKSIFSDRTLDSYTWLALEPVFKSAQISNLKGKNGFITIRGRADRATSIIELLNQQDMVKNVKFDSPIRKQRNKEEFVISFNVEPTEAHE